MDLGLSVRIDSLFLFFCVHNVFEQGGLGGRSSSSLLGSTIDRELSSLSVSSSMINFFILFIIFILRLVSLLIPC